MQNTYLWSPIFLIIVILIYFVLPFEPAIWITVVIGTIFLPFFFINKKKPLNTKIIFLTLIYLGFLIINIHVHFNKINFITKNQVFWGIKATVQDINQRPKNTLLLLNNIDHRKLSNYKKLKITVFEKNLPKNLQVGDRIRISALLIPFTQNALPHEYNEARQNFFTHTDAKGYGLEKIKILHHSHKNLINRWRYNLEKKINNFYTQNNRPNSGLIPALTIGKKNHIPPQIIENFRLSGTAHLLAISGLHLSIFSGWIFLIIRFLLIAIFPRIFAHTDSQILAGIIGITAGFFYLLISGCSISTQRSFIMTTILFLSMILQRGYFNKNSLVTAANLILIYNPAAILSPSFQMSFAGVMAIFCSIRLQKNTANRAINWLQISFLSSLLATLFTAPYAMWHFHTLNLSGCLSNIIAIPLMSLLIMPMIIVLLCTLPFDFSGYIVSVIDFFLQILIKITEFFAHIPYLNFQDLYLPLSTLLLLSLLIWCLFLQINKRIVMGIFTVAVLSLLFGNSRPQALIYNKNIFFPYEKVVYSTHQFRQSKNLNRIEGFFSRKIDKNKNFEQNRQKFYEITSNNFEVDWDNFIISDQKNYYHFDNKNSYFIYCRKQTCQIKPLHQQRPWVLPYEN